MKKCITVLSVLLPFLAGCSNDENIVNEDLTNLNDEKRIAVIAEDFSSSGATRTEYTESANGYSFAWSEGDALGIFPENGYQTAFPIVEGKGVGTNTAIFDGGDWALKANKSYAAYYPFIESLSFSKTEIPIDYTGQVQNGNGSTTHLGKYDYMASTFTEVDDKGNVNFRLQHLGCLVQFKLTMPEEDSYSALEITSDNTPFITSGEYSLSDNDHPIVNVQTSQTITIGLNNISTTAEESVLTVVAMFVPVDLSGSKLTLNVKGDKKSYIFELDGQNLAQGQSVNNVWDIPYVTFHAEAEQTLSMSSAVEKLEYSVNGGAWTTLGTNTVTFGGSNGDLRLRGSNGTGTGKAWNSYSTISFGTKSSVKCSGDIRTLADYANYNTEDTTDDRFYALFSGCNVLVSAPDLPAVTVADQCYTELFMRCTSLTSAPDLPATTISGNSYSKMFLGCTSLTDVPEELPFNTMGNYCCSYMFSGCTSLTTAPRLRSMTLTQGCYYEMFQNCSALTSAPELPATTLAESCYNLMFEGCTSLQVAPALPAEILANGCYSMMFRNCASLTVAPELPATTLKPSCYSSMFDHCTSLAIAPVLPAEKAVENCYSYMFQGCTSLVDAPALPAQFDYWDKYCYSYMFEGCTSLAAAPDLPSTNVSDGCYSHMFEGCTSLTTTPSILPATIVRSASYHSMFKDCSSLEAAPELPAASVSDECYYLMFCNCSRINYLKMMAIGAGSYTFFGILEGAASKGTLVINPNATWVNSYRNQIPSGWTIIKEHESVDLALSVKWATCNIGANNPENFGLYFAWGATTGYTSNTADGFHFNWQNAPLNNGASSKNNTYFETIKNTVCPEGVLASTYDAAQTNWGIGWRLPTKAEWDELCSSSNCIWEWTTVNGQNGCKVTSKKNGNSIFLPAAGLRKSESGYRMDDEVFINSTTNGYYWTSTADFTNPSNDSYSGKYVEINASQHFTYWEGRTYFGFSIRPVCE